MVTEDKTTLKEEAFELLNLGEVYRIERNVYEHRGYPLMPWETEVVDDITIKLKKTIIYKHRDN